MTDWAFLLSANAGAQILFAILLGWAMLMPVARRGTVDHRQLRAAHLDWIMLGLSQAAAALLISQGELTDVAVATVLLIIGGWLNPLPYLFRAFGVDAFRFTGSVVQRGAAAFGGLSSVALTLGWVLLLAAAGPRLSQSLTL